MITGTADAAAEAISAGLTEVGDLMVMYGSSTFFILRTAELREPPGFWASPFLEKDSYVVAGGTATAGSLTRWFRDNFARRRARGAARRRGRRLPGPGRPGLLFAPGSRGLVVLPYFSGERTPLHDPQARGMVFGLGLGHTRADLYRAMLEAVGYSIRHNLEALEEEGCRARRILAVGGGTRNPAWMQMVSDIAGIAQDIPGAADRRQLRGRLPGRGRGRAVSGHCRKFDAGSGTGKPCARMLAPARCTTAYYRIYRELYRRNADLMRELGELAAVA